MSAEDILIREATSEDAEKLLDYLEKVSAETDYLTFGPGEFQLTRDQEQDTLDSYALRTNALYLVAEADGRIVGSLNFSGGSRPRTAHTGEFGISVLKAYWGRHIGKVLLKALIRWAERSGTIRKINLQVREDNERAIRLYTSLGFVREGRISRDLLVNGRFYDSVMMGLSIN